MHLLYSTPRMSEIFSPAAHVRGMLAFEAGLARAQARVGIIPPAAAEAIAAGCKVELFDVVALYEQAARAGTPAIPLVAALTELVAGEAKRYVHWGATSQDALDSALMLRVHEGLSALVEGLDSVCQRCAALAERFRDAVMAGRTLLQQAAPITFGLKAARWLSMVQRRSESLREARDRSTAVQLGGAAGTLAALARHADPGPRDDAEDRGIRLMKELAAELGLPEPDLPWHAERDRVADIASRLGVVAGAMAKIAGDLILLAQTEVAEAAEAVRPGKGVSSAMPHKRNPVDAVRAATAARLAMGQVTVVLSAMAPAHERGAGDWQAEWTAIPLLFCYTACAVAAVDHSLQGLSVDSGRMAENLNRTQGRIMAESLTMALAPEMGRPAARRIVEEICEAAEKSSISVREAARGDSRIAGHLDAAQVDRALDPAAWLGSTRALIERSLQAWRARPSMGSRS